MGDLLYFTACAVIGAGAGYWLAVRRDTRVRRRAGLAEDRADYGTSDRPMTRAQLGAVGTLTGHLR